MARSDLDEQCDRAWASEAKAHKRGGPMSDTHDLGLQEQNFPFQHIRVRNLQDGEVELACTHCLTRRTARSEDPRDFARDSHDFILRHEHCRAPKVQ